MPPSTFKVNGSFELDFLLSSVDWGRERRHWEHAILSRDYLIYNVFFITSIKDFFFSTKLFSRQ